MEHSAMEGATPQVEAVDAAPAAAPAPEAPMEMAEGGMTEDPKVKYMSLALMGIAAASVIYSIYWYRKQLIAMEQKQNGGGKVQQEVEEIKLNLMSLMGDKYQRM
jgi:hypothetical protein|tara:strand:+ start:24390 stop:24704 length:315 start_codon:yes stop_codon:yes gene_type:complete